LNQAIFELFTWLSFLILARVVASIYMALWLNLG